MLHEKLADLKPCFARNLGKFVTSPQMRALVTVATTAYLAFAIYASNSMSVEMNEEDFLAKNSSSAQFLVKYRSAYGKIEDFLEVVFESPIEYYDQRRREDIFSTIRWAVVCVRMLCPSSRYFVTYQYVSGQRLREQSE